ncbi:CoA pyrophosphatase [Streptomyces sp. NPDC046203]|uniref:NUDIX hydrolase n=1 Tax=Streptomyces sp. NPDC046203 TaxID=3154602 RepID=UPI0033D2F651
MADDQTDTSGAALPPWLAGLGRTASASTSTSASAPADLPPELSRYAGPTPANARGSAVLMLFGTGGAGPDLLLLRRSGALRDHPGQVCFPGGSTVPEDGGPVRTALRETYEETGLDTSAVRIAGVLPPLYLAHSGFSVVPVLGWWGAGGRIAGDGEEIVSVHRVPLAELADPGARLLIRLPDGPLAPGFRSGGLFVWGFTGALVAWVLRLGGWERPWDTGRIEDLAAARRRFADGGPPR